LDEIAGELAKLPEAHAPSRRDWARLSSRWSQRIDDRIAELQRLKHGLTECIGCGCLSLGPGRSQRQRAARRGERGQGARGAHERRVISAVPG
jgi:MerR family redox-sensitive transcriptional activator SoxR